MSHDKIPKRTQVNHNQSFMYIYMFHLPCPSIQCAYSISPMNTQRNSQTPYRNFKSKSIQDVDAEKASHKRDNKIGHGEPVHITLWYVIIAGSVAGYWGKRQPHLYTGRRGGEREREREREILLTSSRPLQNEGTWSLSPLGAGGIAGSLYQKAMIATIKVTPAGIA